MRPACSVFRRFLQWPSRCVRQRQLVTLAIETSCDDTAVAVLEKRKNGTAFLHFNKKITSDNRKYGGVYPIEAHESHQRNLAALIQQASPTIPNTTMYNRKRSQSEDGFWRNTKEKYSIKKPDFITVTRGPGMRASLITGMDTAKGLAAAWQIPLVGVNHMQAHALTPRLVHAIHSKDVKDAPNIVPRKPSFPFLTLLVSGGHTMLVHSKGLCDHQILANTTDIAIGDMIDKAARDILPKSILDTSASVMYGPSLESFAFPQKTTSSIRPRYEDHEPFVPGTKVRTSQKYGWMITAPWSRSGDKGLSSYPDAFTFSGIGSAAKRIAETRLEMEEEERQFLVREVMRVSFEHLTNRILIALENDEVSKVDALVVSGGVASNNYLKYVLRTKLAENGYGHIEAVFPPPKYCSDNAAMIAWTGMEMFEAGWTTDFSALARRKWSIDPAADDGGVLGLDGWVKQDITVDEERQSPGSKVRFIG
ncbi:glycoprotease family protein-like protein [Amylocarpus encephaloides]|uniref:Glycoprotease family protein-like protein n=1 Tax=Amylocarpus encephaloides TaxID=45428 RepID=A0A9P8C007_9HELO|nr:glycoprotease family protein-like protein [Amylocarpus encephaloides]